MASVIAERARGTGRLMLRAWVGLAALAAAAAVSRAEPAASRPANAGNSTAAPRVVIGPDGRPMPTYRWTGGPGRDLNGDGVRDLVWFSPFGPVDDPAGNVAVVDAVTGADIARFDTTDGPMVMTLLAGRSTIDLNDDQRVDVADLHLLMGRIGVFSQVGAVPGDINGDGVVDLADLEEMTAAIGGVDGRGWVNALAALAATRPDATVGLRVAGMNVGAGAAGGDGADPLPAGCVRVSRTVICGGGGGGIGDPSGIGSGETGQPGGPGSGTGGGGSGGSGGGFPSPGGGPGIPDPGPGASGCECGGEVFEFVVPSSTTPGGVTNELPRYIGVYDALPALGLRWKPGTTWCRWWNPTCPIYVLRQGIPQGWQFEQGSDLVVNSGAAWAITSNGTPGTIRVRYRVEHENGRVFSAAPATIVVKDYPEVTFQYSAFIECRVIPFELFGYVPPDPLCYAYFLGNNRGFMPDPTEWKIRVRREDIRVRDVPELVWQDRLITAPSPLGSSSAFRDSDVIVWPWQPSWPSACNFALITPLGQACASGSVTWTPQRANLRLSRAGVGVFQGRRTLVIAGVATGDAALPLIPFSPPILGTVYFNLYFETDPRTGEQFVTYARRDSFTSSHTRFPSHEIYLNNTSVYQYSHTARMARPIDLSSGPAVIVPPMTEVTIPLF